VLYISVKCTANKTEQLCILDVFKQINSVDPINMVNSENTNVKSMDQLEKLKQIIGSEHMPQHVCITLPFKKKNLHQSIPLTSHGDAIFVECRYHARFMLGTFQFEVFFQLLSSVGFKVTVFITINLPHLKQGVNSWVHLTHNFFT